MTGEPSNEGLLSNPAVMSGSRIRQKVITFLIICLQIISLLIILMPLIR